MRFRLFSILLAWLLCIVNPLQSQTLNVPDDYYTIKADIPSNRKFSPASEIQLPTVSTTTVAEITSCSAKSGGEIIDAGGGTISARGGCWSANENPTIEEKDIWGKYLRNDYKITRFCIIFFITRSGTLNVSFEGQVNE